MAPRFRSLRVLSRAEWLVMLGLLLVAGTLLAVGLATWGIDYPR